jgi:hypothetical protein
MFELHKRNLLKGVKSCKLGLCKYCVYEKQRRVSFKVVSHTSKCSRLCSLRCLGTSSSSIKRKCTLFCQFYL